MTKIDAVKKSARYWLSVANDPRFLFRNLCEDVNVNALAKTSSVDETLEWLRTHSKAMPESIDDLAMIYARLASLTMHRRDDVMRGLAGLDVSRIPWGKEFMSYLTDSVRPVTIIDVTQPGRDSRNSGTQTVDVRPPKIIVNGAD